ncbi:MAG: flagellar export protein FliJ [Rhodoferax sp.]
MTSFHGLQLAIEQAERMRDERAKVVARLEAHLGSLQAQLFQLETYAQETEKRWMNGAHSQISGELLRHHYQFMGRLQHAMSLQMDVISAARNDIAVARSAQMLVEVRLHGLREVLNKRRKHMERVEVRREQHRSDEFAALAHARNVKVGEHYDD